LVSSLLPLFISDARNFLRAHYQKKNVHWVSGVGLWCLLMTLTQLMALTSWILSEHVKALKYIRFKGIIADHTARYIQQQKCLNKWIGSAILGTQFYNFRPPNRPHFLDVAAIWQIDQKHTYTSATYLCFLTLSPLLYCGWCTTCCN